MVSSVSQFSRLTIDTFTGLSQKILHFNIFHWMCMTKINRNLIIFIATLLVVVFNAVFETLEA